MLGCGGCFLTRPRTCRARLLALPAVSHTVDTHVAQAELLLPASTAPGTDARGLRFVVVTEATCQEHRHTLGVLETTAWLAHKLTLGFPSKHAGLSLL